MGVVQSSKAVLPPPSEQLLSEVAIVCRMAAKTLGNLSKVKWEAMDIARGGVATYFPEANVLVPIDQVAWGSNTPASKSVAIRIIKH